MLRARPADSARSSRGGWCRPCPPRRCLAARPAESWRAFGIEQVLQHAEAIEDFREQTPPPSIFCRPCVSDASRSASLTSIRAGPGAACRGFSSATILHIDARTSQPVAAPRRDPAQRRHPVHRSRPPTWTKLRSRPNVPDLTCGVLPKRRRARSMPRPGEIVLGADTTVVAAGEIARQACRRGRRAAHAPPALRPPP